MSEKLTLELDEDFINSFFKLADLNAPKIDTITLDNLKEVMAIIEKKYSNFHLSNANISSFMEIEDGDTKSGKNILIIDDLGVINYQLEVLFKKLGYYTFTAKEIYDAIDKFKKNDILIVFMDLYIPTEREGFILLDELVKLIKINNLKTKIGIMTASNKKEYKKQCLLKGANFYIEKTDTWQKSLIEICQKAQSESDSEAQSTDKNMVNSQNS